ncbi:MAG TPA: hypothetical protein VGL18_00920 [Actinomycetota bacterium]
MDQNEHTFSPFSREDTAEQPPAGGSLRVGAAADPGPPAVRSPAVVPGAPRPSVDGAWNFGKPAMSSGLPRPRRPIALGLVVVLVAAAGAYFFLNRRSSSSGGTAFALALSRNSTYAYDVHLGMQGTISAQGQQMPLNMQMDQTISWRVESTDSDGTATVAVTATTESAQFNGQPAPAIPSQTTRIRVAKDGRILSAGFEISGFASNSDLGSLVPGSDQFMPLLPDHPVNVGDSWTKRFDQELPFGMGRLRYDVESSLLRYEVIDGKRMAVLFSTLSLPLDMNIDLKKVLAASGNSAGQFSLLGGSNPKMKFGGSMSMQQTAWFDQAHGELYRTSGNATFDMTIEFKDFPRQANAPSGALHLTGTMNLQVQRGESAPKPAKQGKKQAQDRKAQSDLRTAMVAALTYYADHASFAGFTPSAAKSAAPTLAFNTSTKAKRGQVSIRVGGQSIVLVTKSASGTVFCFGRNLNMGTDRYGKKDAKSYAACTGGW